MMAGAAPGAARRASKAWGIAATSLGALAALGAGLAGHKEVTAADYRALRNALTLKPAAFRDQLAEDLEDNRISRWELAMLQHSFGELPAGQGARTAAEERVVLAAIVHTGAKAR